MQQFASPVHAAPDIAQAGVPARHTPDWQVLPVQQSESAMQLPPTATHWHVPLRQVSEPQQSELARHDCVAERHAQAPPVHAAPLQQSLAEAQAPPAELQQVPVVPPEVLVHVSEPQQRATNRNDTADKDMIG